MLDGLNPLQREAVLAPGHILLTACPGSGKTRVLAHKVAYELEKVKESKKIIVALTFTNRAAEEIKKRLLKMDVSPKNLWAGTIHSFCLEWILRPYAGYINEIKNGFVIADEYKSEELISTLKETHGFNNWTRLTTRRNCDGSFAEPNILLHDILTEYHKTLTDQKLIDFDLILYYSYKVLIDYPKIGKTLNNMFHLIAVDEYQDTQELQYAILSKIIKVPNNKTLVFMVGDKDQAIYGSLGGVAKSVQEISNQFGHIAISEYELSGNYRSSQRVIEYYRHYQSSDIIIESLCEHAHERGLITFNKNIDKDNLGKYIADIIQQNLDNGVPESEICVLAPQWWLVIPMGRKLKGLLPKVNFDAIGLSPLAKNKENIWFKVARLFLVDPSPKMYFVRGRWVVELINELESLGVIFLQDNNKKPKALLKIINSISSDKDDGLLYLEDCFNTFLVHLNIEIENHPTLELHWQYFFESSKKRLENPEFDYAKDILSFKRLFSHSSGVVVNTCHGIKGEEFHTVIAFGLLDGYIPHASDLDPIDASRKLLYVICSRSKKHLHLISEKRIRYRQQMVVSTNLRDLNYFYD
ncbi:ATP-dependent helicase [Sphingobacterium puteale]|uniref:DNA 3'-5' helicase n=1 Tax=Sphingobacterium puteale TaxID=2420510 RepID=A0A420W1U9_9SPHI|nr:ATP-dependent helicase [Sphingobacterium puteale]RKO72546.1 ATP-dependent helicase [Sphingobacterium puteale]